MASPPKSDLNESQPPFVPATSDDYNPPLRDKSDSNPPNPVSVQFVPTQISESKATPSSNAGTFANAVESTVSSSVPSVPKAPSPWLEEDLSGGDKSGISFSAATLQRRSKLLNRPPTPPKPRRPPGQISPVNSESKVASVLTVQPHVSFSPVLSVTVNSEKVEDESQGDK
jgi:hypothetical protein